MDSDGPRAQLTWPDIPQTVKDEAGAKLWTFTATVFTADGPMAVHRGTATFVMAAGRPSILTAAHVWNALPGDRFALSLEPNRPLLAVEKDVVVRRTLLTGSSEEWGPDLALLAIPEPLVSAIKVHKAFYDLDRRREAVMNGPARFADGFWGVYGAPAEHSVFDADEATLRVGLFACSDPPRFEREGFDYVELPIDRTTRAHLPGSYGGISGAGLWRFDVIADGLTARPDRTISLGDGVDLEGVAFFEEFTAKDRVKGVIRCHGRKSVYARLVDAIADGSRPKHE
jgi:hypothetical protein